MFSRPKHLDIGDVKRKPLANKSKGLDNINKFEAMVDEIRQLKEEAANELQELEFEVSAPVKETSKK